MKIGDIFTDGSSGREDVRLKNKAKVLYVDKYVLVWFPLNDFTTHTDYPDGWPTKNKEFKSNTWCLSAEPKKVEISDLTEEELINYNSTDHVLTEEI